MATTVNIHQAKTHLSRLLERAQAGETIVIAKAGRPMAELGPIRRLEVVLGGLKDLIEYDDDEFGSERGPA